MAVSTDPPYCLMYPNIYSTTVPHEDRHHFNIQGSPPRLCTHVCICHALLQHADLSEAYRWKYHGSCLVIPRGVQYSHLVPEITMPCNHQAPLVDLHRGEPFPLVSAGDFQLEDNIFPGMPGDSLLYSSDDLAELRRMRFQVTTHRTEQISAVKHKEEKSQSSRNSGEMPSSTSKNGEPSKSRGKSPQAPSSKTTTDSPNRKSLCHNKHSPPPSKEHHGSHDKDSQSSKHWDKSCSESSKSLQKCAAAPPQKPSSTAWVEKEPCLEGPPLVFHALSQSRQLSESDNQFSFTCPTSATTPNKTESGP